MGHVVFDGRGLPGLDEGPRGPVLRGQQLEVRRNFYPAGLVAGPHEHVEEQFLYVLAGRARITLGDETYEVGPGEGSFHPSWTPHRVEIVEDLHALSFKNLVSEHEPSS